MTTRIEWDPYVRSMDDSIEKILGAVLGAAKVAGAAITAPLKVGAKVAGRAASALGIAAKNKLGQKEEELEAVEDEVEAAEEQEEVAVGGQEEQQPDPTKPMPPAATTGAAIQGLQGNEQQGNPTDQPGTTATASTALTRSYFVDNFGIEGGELLNLLEKAGEEDIIPHVTDLLRQEQHAILKSYDWWDEKDWGLLRLQDNDYNLITMYPDRLELPLRQTLAAVKRADNPEALDDVWKQWHTRLNAENRLSNRERGILSSCHNSIRKYGDMNAQTLTSYGVKATTQEVASLIKAYGFMFDVKVVGRGQKSDDRTLYYGTTKPPIFLKIIDSFIGNLWEVSGEMEITKMGVPRVYLPFSTKRAADYTVILKAELGVEGIVWEGRQFVIEGDFAVRKAAQVALPFLSDKRQEVCIVLSALNGDENAGRILAYQNAPTQEQITMLKEWNVSEEKMDEWAEVIENAF